VGGARGFERVGASRKGVSVPFHRIGIRQLCRDGKQAPEPSVDLDRSEVPAVVGQVLGRDPVWPRHGRLCPRKALHAAQEPRSVRTGPAPRGSPSSEPTVLTSRHYQTPRGTAGRQLADGLEILPGSYSWARATDRRVVLRTGPIRQEPGSRRSLSGGVHPDGLLSCRSCCGWCVSASYLPFPFSPHGGGREGLLRSLSSAGGK
jgi:hypothetical protein